MVTLPVLSARVVCIDVKCSQLRRAWLNDEGTAPVLRSVPRRARLRSAVIVDVFAFSGQHIRDDDRGVEAGLQACRR